MVIIWRGIGLPILMAGGLVAGLIVALFDWGYVANHAWPRITAFGVGGVVVYWIGSVRETKYGIRDSVYFIPMKAWAVLLFIGGICWSFMPAEAFQARARGSSQQPARYAAPSTPRRAATENGLRLQGIFYSADNGSTAIINNQTVGIGEKVGGFTVRTITAQSVTVQAANGQATVLRPAVTGR